MFILNFGHPLTTQQTAAVERLAGQSLERVIEREVQIDPASPLTGQVAAVVEGVGLSPAQWQTVPLLVNLPGYAVVAVCLLAQIEGRRGHLPTVIQMQSRAGAVLTEYDVVALVNLEAERASARLKRYA